MEANLATTSLGVGGTPLIHFQNGHRFDDGATDPTSVVARKSEFMEAPRHFSHIVFFTLVDRSPPARARLVAECHEHLAGHDGVSYFGVGVISDNARDVNDRDYDVSLQMVFASRTAHDAYQISPRHQQFIEGNRSNWARVRVFDSDLA